MKIAVLGTGMVGQTIGTRLIQLGHEVKMGSRDAAHPNAVLWAKAEGAHASFGTFENAAAFGEIVFNCTLGTASLQALHAAGAANLAGKLLLDLANPIDYSTEIWTLSVANTDSLGEQIQRAFPEARVVKTLNTVNAGVMVNPTRLSDKSDAFVSGDDIEAKATVVTLLRDWFGWKSVIDLGDIRTARSVELYVLLWQHLQRSLKSARFNIRVIGP